MRISEIALASLCLIGVAGCSKPAADPTDSAASASAVTGQGRVLCAVHGTAAFVPECTIERIASANGLELTIRHPDGGFRKLLVTKDGRGVIAADGAEPARVTVTGDREIEVSLAGDRYRLPATVKGKSLRP